MTLKELEQVRHRYLSKYWQYERSYWSDFDYSVLNNCIYRKSFKRKNHTYNDITIMIDTETSKAEQPESYNQFEYDDILASIKSTKLKWQDSFREVATKRELQLIGFNFKGSYGVDSLYQELQSKYPWLFNDCYSDIQCLDALFDYLVTQYPEQPILDNHIVIWTLSIRMFDLNIATLYGRKPSELIDCIDSIMGMLQGQTTYMYIFNLSYDYVFLRKFLNKAYGEPIRQLNVKPHYPINLEYANGLVLKDALILAQRKLSKWAEDMQAEHQKAVGDWDYNIIRHQNTPISEDELHYAEFDTLAGVECIDILKNQLHKTIGQMPFTSTGILREIIKKVGAENKAREWLLKLAPTFNQYVKQTKIYHGGYTHGNRHHLNELIKAGELLNVFDESSIIENVKGGDFASSYPFSLFKKYPSSKFIPIENKSMQFILKHSGEYAFMFKLRAVNVRLKNDDIPMPFLQYSKTDYTINEMLDNGRIIACDYMEIWLNELDLSIVEMQYDMDYHICTEVEASLKDYLPRWFTDIVWQLFKEKTELKGIDDVLYNIAKFKLNSCYGLCCQRWDKPEIIEQIDGSYIEDTTKSAQDLFNETLNKRSTILPYCIGAWCTSYSTVALFKMGSMCDIWLYSDTDSCYGLGWHMQEVEAYNQECINFMQKRGYGGGAFSKKGKHCFLGVIEFDEDCEYSEFKYMGAKRYAGRCVKDNEIHITVAGVPKKDGAKCLNNDMNNFHPDFIFDGEITGKKTHTHLYIDDIYINEYGDEVGDSIDLSPCDYKLDMVTYHSLNDYIFMGTEIKIDIAEDCDDLELIY